MLIIFFIQSGVKIPRVKSKVKSKRKADAYNYNYSLKIIHNILQRYIV